PAMRTGTANGAYGHRREERRSPSRAKAYLERLRDLRCVRSTQRRQVSAERARVAARDERDDQLPDQELLRQREEGSGGAIGLAHDALAVGLDVRVRRAVEEVGIPRSLALEELASLRELFGVPAKLFVDVGELDVSLAELGEQIRRGGRRRGSSPREERRAI